MMKELVAEQLGRDFWTILDEMVEDIIDLGYEVAEANEEYVIVVDEDDDEVILYLGHAGSTIWVEKVR